MVTYILLMKMTDKGVADIKNAPQRAADAVKLWESMGGRTLGIYMTVGDYDYVGIGEGPDDQTAAAFALALSSAGMVRTTSLKAYGMEEAQQIIGTLAHATAVVA